MMKKDNKITYLIIAACIIAVIIGVSIGYKINKSKSNLAFFACV